MYHRVFDAPTDPWGMCVGTAHFSEHMKYLSRNFSVLHLQDLVQRWAEGELPSNAAVVTFDDGYVDNLANAKPVLERWKVPATVFVATEYTGHSREFWWDELDRIVLQPGTLPKELRLGLDGEILEWDLGSSARYTEKDHRRFGRWRAEGTADPTPRHALYKKLYSVLQPLAHTKKVEILDQLLTWANASPQGRPDYRALSSDELLSVEEGGLVGIGAHTVTHPVLSSLSTEAQRDEIVRAKEQLEKLLGHPVPHFAYPHGARGAFTNESVALVRAAGFVSACSSLEGVVRPDNDILQLPRMQVRDWNKNEFGKRLAMFASSN